MNLRHLQVQLVDHSTERIDVVSCLKQVMRFPVKKAYYRIMNVWIVM
jgi:hypothetical protein